VDFLHQVDNNKVIIVSGEGTPQIFQRIAPSFLDIRRHGNIDRFVISVDSEEMDCQAKLDEVMLQVRKNNPPVPVYPIIQHYCFETWALGNRAVGSKRPKDTELATFKRSYDVARFDPSLMPSLSARLNRSQFSEVYLRRLLNDQHKGLSYSKADPSVVCHTKYYDQVLRRQRDTGHITSFQQFVVAFS
jgi:hypothetical protein